MQMSNIRVTAWISGCFCLILLTVSVFLWLSPPHTNPANRPTLSTNNSLTDSPNTTVQPQAAVTTPQTTVTLTTPAVPPAAYPLGSIGEACEVSEYPSNVEFLDLNTETFLSLPNSPFDSDGNWKQLLQPKCWTALENHMKPINPYLWGKKEHTLEKHHVIALVLVDNPLTFERVLTDPVEDFARLQEALARPECRPKNDTPTNWNLNETCHGDAIFNYAMFSRFCYGEGIFNRPSPYWDEPYSTPITPKQDGGRWIENLENAWVFQKCEELDQNLNLRLPVHTELWQQIQALQISDENNRWGPKTVNAKLIELAARLGNVPAGLTYPFDHGDSGSQPYNEEGYKYGPLAEWFTTVFEPAELFIKQPPSVDRLRQLIPMFGKNIKLKGVLINFDHEALAKYLCAPPYYTPPSDEETAPEPSSCRAILTDLRQEFHNDTQTLKLIATFEEIAMRLDVYE